MTVKPAVQSAVRTTEPPNPPMMMSSSGARQTNKVNQGLDNMSPFLATTSSLKTHGPNRGCAPQRGRLDQGRCSGLWDLGGFRDRNRRRREHAAGRRRYPKRGDCAGSWSSGQATPDPFVHAVLDGEGSNEKLAFEGFRERFRSGSGCAGQRRAGGTGLRS